MRRSGEIELTPTERRNREGNILFAARLLLGGAYISPKGTLLLTDNQRENAAATGDPLVSSAAQKERLAREQWLATPLGVVFIEDGISREQAGKFVKRLDSIGLTQLNHVIAYGRAFTSSTHGIGPAAIYAIQGFISRNSYGVEWYDKPTMECIADVCPTLSDVPRVCLKTYGRRFNPRVQVYPRGSMAELLTKDAVERELWVHKDTPQSVVDVEAASVYGAVRQFANDFISARQRVEYPDIADGMLSQDFIG